jgi:outer membrane protein assembly factor BamB
MKHQGKQLQKVVCIAVFSLLFTSTGFATKIHKIYEDPTTCFSQSQLNKRVMVGPAGTDSIYVMLDNRDGILLMRTNMDGSPIWTHLYGESSDEASTIGEATDGNIIMVSYALSNIDAVATKIDAIKGAVIWSYRYPGLNEASTITKRGARHVLMGDTTLQPSTLRPIV